MRGEGLAIFCRIGGHFTALGGVYIIRGVFDNG